MFHPSGHIRRSAGRRRRVVAPSVCALLAALAAGCIRMPVLSAPAAVSAPKDPTPTYGPFKLKPDFEGPCSRADVVDVNLGHTPETFVRAAHCQVTGQPAPDAVVQQWAQRMRDAYYVRRIDVVRSLCASSKRECKLAYSDPWLAQEDLGGTNCSMDWANNHAPGMDKASPALGFEPGQSAPYHPAQPGFWRRELLDARYAGLSFLMLNTYGPDIADGKLKPLTDALKTIESPVKLALFDDTWTWGQPYFGDFWKQKPDLTDSDRAAKTIYESKWKPFFSQIDKKHWYRFAGRPFIYFYNAGRTGHRQAEGAVQGRLWRGAIRRRRHRVLR
jgi:hypothetical protein